MKRNEPKKNPKTKTKNMLQDSMYTKLKKLLCIEKAAQWLFWTRQGKSWEGKITEKSEKTSGFLPYTDYDDNSTDIDVSHKLLNCVSLIGELACIVTFSIKL